MPHFTAESTDTDKRLDVFLSEHLQTSRSQLQKIIKGGDVLLNHATAKPHTLVKEGDDIQFPELLQQPPQTKKAPAPLLDILYQDDDLLVINKPAGLLVHPVGPQDDEPTVVDALLERLPDVHQVGEDPLRPGIVHRLDKDVSGVMVLAKTSEAFFYLKEQFQLRKMKKEYLALVYGSLPKDHDVITLKIGRSKTLGRMVARPEQQEGKEAHTEYEVLERFKTATFVRVWIKTGRTHQIRAHFKAIDHPVVGDKLYKKPHMKNLRPIPLNRIFLHAHRLTFILPSGKQKTFEIPLPQELNALLKQLPAL